MEKPEFRKELESLINRHSMENGSDTPDFMLAEYLHGCLINFDKVVSARERWYRRKPKIGELQDILNQPNPPENIRINPDGSVSSI